VSTFVDIGDYPGRGVLVRRRSDGDLEWVYFVTGRSESSRRRRARQVGDVVYIEPTGPGHADPLRHYACARTFSEGLIVGNGDHVDVLAEQLDDRVGLEAALTTITPEPDPPINTPRIGAVIRQRFCGDLQRRRDPPSHRTKDDGAADDTAQPGGADDVRGERAP
jgi:IMP cyclohydrolase